MARVLGLALIASVLTVSLGLDYPWNGPCRSRYDGPYKETETKTYTAPANCTEGRFDWNYPVGTTLFHIQSSVYRNFQFCFEDMYGSQMAGYWHIYDVTGGQNFPIAKPKGRGYVVCRPSRNGRVDLRLEATDDKTYVAAFAYKLETN